MTYEQIKKFEPQVQVLEDQIRNDSDPTKLESELREDWEGIKVQLRKIVGWSRPGQDILSMYEPYVTVRQRLLELFQTLNEVNWTSKSSTTQL